MAAKRHVFEYLETPSKYPPAATNQALAVRRSPARNIPATTIAKRKAIPCSTLVG